MASVPRTSELPVHLCWSEKDGLITVTSQDEDRFNIKLNRAVEALQQADKVDKFKRQFNLLIKILLGWVKERSDVRDAHLTLRDGGFSFVVVRQVPEYNEEFEDELSDLDYRIANDVDLDLLKLDVIGLPPASQEAIQTFIDPNFHFSLQPHANAERSESSDAGEQES